MSKYKCNKCGNSTFDWEYKCDECGSTFINENSKFLFSSFLLVSLVGSFIGCSIFVFEYFELSFSLAFVFSNLSLFLLILTGFFEVIDNKNYTKLYKKFVQSMYRDKINWAERSYIPGTSISYISTSSSDCDCDCDRLVPFGIGILFGIGIS